MKELNVADGILPIAEFKARASEIFRQLRESGRPVVITQNGRPAGVLVSPTDFDALSYRQRVAAAIKEGLDDAEAGRVVSDEDLDGILDNRVGMVEE